MKTESVYIPRLSETVTSAPSSCIQGTSISLHCSGSCPGHPPHTNNTFLPFKDGSTKSSVDKFYTPDDLKSWLNACGANPGDLLLVLCGETETTQKQLSELRLEMGTQLGIAGLEKEDGNLYLEIRVGGKPQDPKGWLQLK